jgi:hypothetical protein
MPQTNKLFWLDLRKKNDSFNPFYFQKCSSLVANLIMLNFLEDILHLLNYCLKFETNPTVDLRETIILNINPEACS